MDLDINGKVALVGGSSRGLGLGCALQLAKEGVHLALCARGKNDLKKAKKKIKNESNVKVLTIATDLEHSKNIEDSVQNVIEHFGRIDILINNSGGPKPGLFFELDDDDWLKAYNQVLAYNVKMCHLVIPFMKKNKWGRIINITSMTAKEPADNLILSNVFRLGIISLSRTLARELISDNITINNICPGAFKTSRAIQLMESQATKKNISIEEVEKNIIKNLPLGRFHKLEDIGNLVAFIASELARGLTGTTISIDGGKQRSLF